MKWLNAESEWAMNLKDGSMFSTLSRARGGHRSRKPWSILGQATVEFAIVSIIFLMLVLGTLDLGRAIYMYSQLTNSVREGARYAQVAPTDTNNIKQRVISYSSGLGLSTSDVTVTCSSSCTTGNDITVSAHMTFSLVAQMFLGISPFTMHAHATDAID